MKNLIYPNLSKEVRKYGKFDGMRCYNCGSCTISCPISDDTSAFPRKPIQYVHIGAKEEILSSIEPWVCHWCGDCSTTCPQKAEPGESMNTIRKYLSSFYDWTGISSLFNKYWFFKIGLYLFSLILVFALIAGYHLIYVKKVMGEFGIKDLFSKSNIEGVGLEHVFGGDTGPENIMVWFTVLFFLIPLFLLIINGFRMWYFTMKKNSNLKIPFSLYITQLRDLFWLGGTQKKFSECKEKNMWIRHITLFAGFLLISFIVFFFLKFFQTDKIYPLYHPQRWLGYIATALMLYGSGAMILGRISKKEEIHKKSDFSDWSLPILTFLVALSGILIHIFRYAKLGVASHYMFFAHILILAPLMLIELPFGKLSHLLYHSLALYFKGIKEKVEKGKEVEEEKVA